MTDRRLLLLATTTGYQTRMFAEAADRLGVELVYATDRCDQLDDPWSDGAIPVRFHDEAGSLAAVLSALEARPVQGVLAVGDRPVVLAALVLGSLGLPGHPVDAAAAARDKRLMRAHIEAAHLLTPARFVFSLQSPPAEIAARLTFPVVVKPTVISGSRGVIRADDPASFEAVFRRVRRLLESADVRSLRDPQAELVQVERYIDGVEFAVEGLLDHGRLHVFAVFDKPDPLVGPFFEETIYVTPSRARESVIASIVDAVNRAVLALGLYHGPIHAECRVASEGVYVLEVAARPIGGLCARSLRFEAGDRGRIGLEELLVRHALGEPVTAWSREAPASGVMMVPIPRAGVLRGVSGLEEARAVPGVDEVTITARTDQVLVPLPEGASYLGFIFARAGLPAEVEVALRDAHERLGFRIDPALPMLDSGTQDGTSAPSPDGGTM